MSHESADQAIDFFRGSLAKVDQTLYRTISLPHLGEEGYTFANCDGSRPGTGVLSFRIGKVTFGVTSNSDEVAQSVSNSVSTFMRLCPKSLSGAKSSLLIVTIIDKLRSSGCS